MTGLCWEAAHPLSPSSTHAYVTCPLIAAPVGLLALSHALARGACLPAGGLDSLLLLRAQRLWQTLGFAAQVREALQGRVRQ